MATSSSGSRSSQCTINLRNLRSRMSIFYVGSDALVDSSNNLSTDLKLGMAQ